MVNYITYRGFLLFDHGRSEYHTEEMMRYLPCDGQACDLACTVLQRAGGRVLMFCILLLHR